MNLRRIALSHRGPFRYRRIRGLPVSRMFSYHVRLHVAYYLDCTVISGVNIIHYNDSNT